MIQKMELIQAAKALLNKYILRWDSDQVIEAFDKNINPIISAIGYALGDNVERLEFNNVKQLVGNSLNINLWNESIDERVSIAIF